VRYEAIQELLVASVSDEIYIHLISVISANRANYTMKYNMEQPEMLVQNKQKGKVNKSFKLLYRLKQLDRE